MPSTIGIPRRARQVASIGLAVVALVLAGSAFAKERKRPPPKPAQRPPVVIDDRSIYYPPPARQERYYYGPAPTIQPPMERVPLPAPLAQPPIR